MNLLLKRDTYGFYGVFGKLYDSLGNFLGVTLEHPYPMETCPATWQPKVAPGIYTCLKHPPNRLPYETWELQNVPEFEGQPVTDILIHKGNYASDSEGCIILANSLGAGCVLDSKFAFDKFMTLTADETSLTITIS